MTNNEQLNKLNIDILNDRLLDLKYRITILENEPDPIKHIETPPIVQPPHNTFIYPIVNDHINLEDSQSINTTEMTTESNHRNIYLFNEVTSVTDVLVSFTTTDHFNPPSFCAMIHYLPQTDTAYAVRLMYLTECVNNSEYIYSIPNFTNPTTTDDPLYNINRPQYEEAIDDILIEFLDLNKSQSVIDINNLPSKGV